MPAEGQYPGTLEAGHARAHHHRVTGCGLGCRRRGRGVDLHGLVARTGLAHATDQRIAVVPDPAGLVAQDARADLGGATVADLGHERRVGDQGPGHLDQVGRPVGQRALGHAHLDHAPLQHDREPATGSPAHGRAQVPVHPGRGVGIGSVGGGRVGATADHDEQVDGVDQCGHLLGGVLGGDPRPRCQLVARQAQPDDPVGPHRRPDGVHHRTGEREPVLAVGVAPEVGQPRVELAQDRQRPGVELDAGQAGRRRRPGPPWRSPRSVPRSRGCPWPSASPGWPRRPPETAPTAPTASTHSSPGRPRGRVRPAPRCHGVRRRRPPPASPVHRPKPAGPARRASPTGGPRPSR